MARYKVKFLPSEGLYQAEDGENLLDVAMRSGVHVNASCGGNGSCGKCRIVVREGVADSPPHRTISPEDYDRGVRLACTTTIHGDLTAEVPLESQVDRAALQRRRETALILSAPDAGRVAEKVRIDPPVSKRYLELPAPTAADNVADLARLERTLRDFSRIGKLSADLKVLKGLGKTLRAEDWRATVTLAALADGHALLKVEPGNRETENYSIVIDVGTTTVCGQLLRLSERDPSRSVLSESSDYNSQISFGEDVISRILFSRKKGGLRKLQEAVAATMNKVIMEMLESSGVSPQDVSHVILAGNTTMSHLALGLDPTWLMLAPYTPVTVFYPPVRAASLGIKLDEYTRAYIFPSVASYVGGDVVAGVLASGMTLSEETTLFMDIGTNGEIVLGNRDWLTCASCSAGPAFEGGGIEFGMRAGRGAIEQVRINPTTLEPMILTIGKVKPMGICGSGLIDTVAGLLKAGLIDQKGKFERDNGSPRVRAGASGYEYVLSYAPDTGIGRDIVITEVDLDNLIRTKGAIYAGCKVLLAAVGLTFGDVDRIVIAGGFGHYIDLEQAITIGLLPELPAERFFFAGNSSLSGARQASFSKKFLGEAEKVAKMMTNIELSTNPAFMDEFVAAMFLPHTDGTAFPETTERFRTLRSDDTSDYMNRE